MLKGITCELVNTGFLPSLLLSPLSMASVKIKWNKNKDYKISQFESGP